MEEALMKANRWWWKGEIEWKKRQDERESLTEGNRRKGETDSESNYQSWKGMGRW
jgi:hypothetical protein